MILGVFQSFTTLKGKLCGSRVINEVLFLNSFKPFPLVAFVFKNSSLFFLSFFKVLLGVVSSFFGLQIPKWQMFNQLKFQTIHC